MFDYVPSVGFCLCYFTHITSHITHGLSNVEKSGMKELCELVKRGIEGQGEFNTSPVNNFRNEIYSLVLRKSGPSKY